eukprot:scaffold4044_cov399-Prasinococcus_capsulatus_cf.AAC.10
MEVILETSRLRNLTLLAGLENQRLHECAHLQALLADPLGGIRRSDTRVAKLRKVWAHGARLIQRVRHRMKP